jgi:hypothetical protein
MERQFGGRQRDQIRNWKFIYHRGWYFLFIFEKGFENLQLQVRQMSRVNHPNIIRLYGVSLREPSFIVMEYADGGSLYDYLHCKPKRPYKASHAMSWAKQTAEVISVFFFSLMTRGLFSIILGSRLSAFDETEAVDS